MHVLHIYFGFVINTTAYHLGSCSLHLLLLKSSMTKVYCLSKELLCLPVTPFTKDLHELITTQNNELFPKPFFAHNTQDELFWERRKLIKNYLITNSSSSGSSSSKAVITFDNMATQIFAQRTNERTHESF